MKKFISLLMVLMTLSVSTADAKAEFLYDAYFNYSSQTNVKANFNDCKELVALLRELEMPEELENFIDIEALFSSLLSAETTIDVQVDMSEDLKRIELSLSTESGQSIAFNKNFNINLNGKNSIWIKMDMSDAQNPIFKMIYDGVMCNKYMEFDFIAMIPEEERESFVTTLCSMFDEVNLKEQNRKYAEIIEKYSEMTTSGNRHFIKIDNNAFLNIISEVTIDMYEKHQEALESSNTYDVVEVDQETVEAVDNEIVLYDENETDEIASEEIYLPEAYYAQPDINEVFKNLPESGVNLLGKNGIVYTYELVGGKISSEKVEIDISLDISELYEMFTGQQWMYESQGNIEFSAESFTKLSKRGLTKVDFPQLTEENSFSLMDMYAEDENFEYADNEKEVYEPSYPNWYVYGHTKDMPIIYGDFYVPLRLTLDEAYDGNVYISYDNGEILLTCGDYFPGFTDVVMKIGCDTIYIDGTPIPGKKVIEKDGVAYVSSTIFEEVFGWELTNAMYNLLSEEYEYSFYTRNYY